MDVLRASGVEAESELAFAGLFGLVRPILGYMHEVPEAQAAALAGALGLGPSAGADRFLVSAAVLGLLAAAAEERPVLCLVDDAQWLDAPSADALVFAARRLGADRVATLFGAREGEARRFEAVGLPELVLEGLEEDSAAAVLSERARDAVPTVRSRLLAEAHGNPLALIELPASLTQQQRAGVAPLPETIPLTPRLQAVFRQRILNLAPATQTALLIASAEDTGELATVLRAGAELGLNPDALDAAERADLIQIAGGAIVFRHPLVRSALYEGATSGQRQRVHEALANALSGEENADRRVWHQAIATVTADEEVAAALEASARRAQKRAAHASAASAFLRSAELSRDEHRRVRRVAAAAQAAWDAGRADQARAALARALPASSGELRARLLHLKGVIDAQAGNVRDAPAILLEAVEATADSSYALELLQEAGEAASYAGQISLLVGISQRQAAGPAVTERDRFLVESGAGWAGLHSRQHSAADAAFTDALGRASALEDPRALVWAANTASAARDFGAGLPYAARAVELVRKQGLLSLLPMALHRYGQELLWNSHFDAAYAAAQEGYQLSVDLGYGSGGHLANLAAVEAVWGREADAREHAGQALAIGRQTNFNLLADSAEFTLAFIELAAGRVDAATDRLLWLTTPDRPDANQIIVLGAVPDLVEAAVRAGRADQIVTERLAMYRVWAGYTATGSGQALLARCEALLGERPPDEAFSEANERAPSLPPFQRGRTELLYGEWLRRKPRRQEARVHLRAALELFLSLRAIPWERRAEAELRATGETTRRRDPSTLDQLTPQELQIAGLVADGLTNRDIAAQLYLSPRTIDYHLRKVFTKLGIASRTQLVRHEALLGQPD